MPAAGMIGEPVRWSDEFDEVIRGDLAAAVGFHTSLGGRGPGRRADRRPPAPAAGLSGADGFPVVVPVELAGHDAAGLRLVVFSGMLPVGGRRAAYSPTPTARSAERPFRRLYDSQPAEQATVHIGGYLESPADNAW